MRERSNKSASNFVLSLDIPPQKLLGWLRWLWGQCSEWSTNKSVAQMLQRWSRICWKWSTFWKACNKQNTWECWRCRGCNQQRSATDCENQQLIWDSKNHRVWAFDTGSWHETKITFEREEISDCQWDSGKYNRAVDGDSNKGVSGVFWTLGEMLGDLCEVPRCLLWRRLRHYCPMYNVSCILYLLQ